MKKRLLLLSFLVSFGILEAQNIFNYGFNGVSADLTTAGWTRFNLSAPNVAARLWNVSNYTSVTVNTSVPDTDPAYVQANPFGDITYTNGQVSPIPVGQAGGNNSFAVVNFASTSPVGTISNWMISPIVTVQNGDVVSFYTRLGQVAGAPGTEYPDRLQLRMSTDGAFSVDPVANATGTGVGTYTTILNDVNPTLVTGVYPKIWTQYTYTVVGLPTPTDVKFAFRYFVTSGGINGANSNIIGLDTFSVDRPVVATDTFSTVNFKFGPNPIKDILNLSFDKNITNVTVINLLGQEVLSSKLDAQEAKINMLTLTSGAYMVKVTADNEVKTIKVIKE